jgi:serine/threonine-protein kinase
MLTMLVLTACLPLTPATQDLSSAGEPPAATDTVPPAATPLPTETTEPTAQPTTQPTPGIGTTQLAASDGMLLVFVPEGPFLMGSPDGYGDEKPPHTLLLPAFWIDSTEVTNGMYAQCVAAGACERQRRNSSNVVDFYSSVPEYANYPVVWVSWLDAQAYCTWAGRRLPTEAEWEKAARGPDGYLYPWGNVAPAANLANYDHLLPDTTAVGSFPAGASLYGAQDMAGNVTEWVADWYAPEYYGLSPEFDPQGPEAGTRRVLRGGSWTANADGLRASYRYAKPPETADFDTGFRCAWDDNP